MEKIKHDIDIKYITEIDLDNNSKEIIELLNDNYLINFSSHADLSSYAILTFNNMKKFLKDGSALIIGAYSGEKVIGILWAYKRLFLGEDRLHISQVVVDASFRGCGIGTRMIDSIEQYALKKEIKVIELLATRENERTIEFYNRHGFSVTRVQFEKNMGKKEDNK